MTPTENSEHAKQALIWYNSEAFLRPLPLIEAIQHGINLAVESKDREIERLKEVVDRKEREILGFSQELDDAESETGELEKQLTEANAKLAEAESRLRVKQHEIEALDGCLRDATEDRNLAEERLKSLRE